MDKLSDEQIREWIGVVNHEPARNALRELIALRQQASQEGDGWRDISSAPKDGTPILCYFPLDGLGKDWCRTVPVFFADQVGFKGWAFASRAASGFSRGYEPTHWRPLPAPPTVSPGNGG